MSTFITRHAKENDLKKVDAKRSIAITVKACDIRGANTKSPSSCALARAAKRSFGAKAAYFFRSICWLEFENRLVRYILPTSAQKEIVAFDRGASFEPGDYHLKAPSKSTTLKAIKERSEKRPGRHQPGSTGIKRKFLHKTENVRGMHQG